MDGILGTCSFARCLIPFRKHVFYKNIHGLYEFASSQARSTSFWFLAKQQRRTHGQCALSTSVQLHLVIYTRFSFPKISSAHGNQLAKVAEPVFVAICALSTSVSRMAVLFLVTTTVVAFNTLSAKYKNSVFLHLIRLALLLLGRSRLPVLYILLVWCSKTLMFSCSTHELANDRYFKRMLNCYKSSSEFGTQAAKSLFLIPKALHRT